MTKLRSGLVCAIAVSRLGFPAWAATITEFDPPGSIFTYPAAVSGGVITGFYQNSFGDVHGFVRAADGSITTFDPPTSTETYATSINKAGTITGYYGVGSGVEHGVAPFNPCTSSGGGCFFVRTADGAITVFAAPGAPTSVISINNSGVIAGSYTDSNNFGDLHGFVRFPHGKITTFDPTGSTSTLATSINEGGAITGYYQDASGNFHGFLRATDGSITSFDVPQSTFIVVAAIDKAGAITGGYLGRDQLNHGFVRAADGTFATFDPSGSTDTFGASIANSGTVTGSYQDASGFVHGFLRKAAGRISAFDPPGASQTFPRSIDSARTDKDVITGSYNSRGQYHGFLRTP